MKWNFDGKIALITGGASGIGRQIAMDMATSGASIAIFDVDAVQGNKTLGELQAISKRSMRFFQGSVSNKTFVEETVQKIFKEMGEVDFLINCAGVLRDFMIDKFDEKKWDITIEVNLKGVAICTEAVATQWAAISKAKATEKGINIFQSLKTSRG